MATARMAAELDALVQIHVAETAAEGQGILAEHGCSAPELLARLGVLDCRVLAAHSVWLSDADLDLYQQHDVAVAHCPQSNGKLGSGVARLADMLARGIRVGLGTDGPASNDNLDLWEEMRLAPLLARAPAPTPPWSPPARPCWLATRGGAEALGLDTGSLRPGRPADFIRLELETRASCPRATRPNCWPIWCGPPPAGWSPTSGSAAARWWPPAGARPSTPPRPAIRWPRARRLAIG